MTKKTILWTVIMAFSFFQNVLAVNAECSRDSFTQEQLNNPYAAGTKKILMSYSGSEALNLVRSIETIAKYESNSVGLACDKSSSSCWGADESWIYSKVPIRDVFDNILGFDGNMSSKLYVHNWPANEKYYAHQTNIGFTCVWESPDAYCEKWCSITVIDDRFHD